MHPKILSPTSLQGTRVVDGLLQGEMRMTIVSVIMSVEESDNCETLRFMVQG